MKKTWIGILSVFLLAGCANMEKYYQSVDSANQRQVEAARARAEADAIKYQALMRIAESGDVTAKVAATMALAMGETANRPTQVVVPAQPQNEALQWASILVPGITQLGMGYYNMKQNINSSNNSRILGISTNQTFGQFASEINSPVIVEQPDPVIVQQPDPVIVQQPDPVIVNPVVVNPVIVPVPVTP